MLHQVRLFFVALQFFTRLPIPAWVGFEPAWLQHASRYFPLVGLVVGAISAAAYGLAAWVLPATVAAVLATCASVLATGAFHEDGFADVCDGLGGYVSAERALAIMKDSRIGAYGAIGIALLLGLKCATLAALPPATAVAALLLAHPASRLAACTLIWGLNYVRGDDSKAKPLAQHMRAGELALAALCVALVVLGLGLWGALGLGQLALALALAAVLCAIMARGFVRRLGGYTGDCLGAVQQVSEVGVYLALLACTARPAWS